MNAIGNVQARNPGNAIEIERHKGHIVFPRELAIGSLCHYITGADPEHYEPANITFDLLPSLDEGTRARFGHDKKARHAEVCRRAIESLEEYLAIHV